MPVTRTAARRFAVALVAVLLFAGWLAAFAALLTPQPRAMIRPRPETSSVQFSPDSKALATFGEGKRSYCGPLQVWDVHSGQERYSVADGWDALEAVQFSPDGTLLAAYQVGDDLKVWDVRSGTEIFSFRPTTRPATWVSKSASFQFTPDSKCLVVWDRGENPKRDCVVFLDVHARVQVASFEPSPALEFSADGRHLTTWHRRDGADVTSP
jgi:WD40 repeat protein